jgi:hypothetical protein
MLMMDRMIASGSRRITLSNLRPDTVRHSPTSATSDSTRTVCRVSPSCVTRVSRSNFATEIDGVGEREIASDLGRLERRMRDLIDVRVTPDRQAHLAPKQR